MPLKFVSWVSVVFGVATGFNSVAEAQVYLAQPYVAQDGRIYYAAASAGSNGSWVYTPVRQSFSSSYSTYGNASVNTGFTTVEQANIFGLGGIPQAGSNPLVERIEALLFDRFERWLDQQLGLNPCNGTSPTPDPTTDPGTPSDPDEITSTSPTPSITANSLQPNLRANQTEAVRQRQRILNENATRLHAADLVIQRARARQNLENIDKEFQRTINAGNLQAKPAKPAVKAQPMTEQQLNDRVNALLDQIIVEKKRLFPQADNPVPETPAPETNVPAPPAAK